MTMTNPTPRPGLAAAKKRDLVRHVGKLERKLHRARLRIGQLLHQNGVLAARTRVLEADRDALETKLDQALSPDIAAVAESNRQRMLRAEQALEEIGAILTRITADALARDPNETHGYAVLAISTPTLVNLAGRAMTALQDNAAEPVKQANLAGLVGADEEA